MPDELLDRLSRAERHGVEDLARRALALERLVEISREISTLDAVEAIRRILASVLELTGTERAALLLVGESGELELGESVGFDGEPDGPARELSHSVAQAALGSGVVEVVADLPGSRFRNHTSVLALHLETVVAIPLATRERTLGVLYLDSTRPSARQTTIDPAILAAFGAQAAVALENARLHRRLADEHFALKRALEGTFQLEGLVYRSAAMTAVAEAVRRVAGSELPVLVCGETGTGKELVAQAVHRLSGRRARPLLATNAGALADSLLESELFGHRRGAFTGAHEARAGLLEAAHGGTVFLDEIGEASPALQVRLLRFLETGTFRRVGDTAERHSDVRVVAATHRDLGAEVRAGRFREDLFYRLSVFPIRVPPLRERPEDVEVLTRVFLAACARDLGRPVPALGRETLAALLRRPWPGNVRELRNVIQRWLLLSPPGQFLPAPEDESPLLGGPAAEETAGGTLEQVERAHIARTLAECSGNLSDAARRLGLPRGTLRWRIKKLGLAGEA